MFVPSCPQVLGLPPPPEADATASSDGEGPAAAAAARRRGAGPKKGRPPLYSYYVKVKKQHPKAVALVRVRHGRQTLHSWAWLGTRGGVWRLPKRRDIDILGGTCTGSSLQTVCLPSTHLVVEVTAPLLCLR